MSRSPMNGAAAPQSPLVTVRGALPSGKDRMTGLTKKDRPRRDATIRSARRHRAPWKMYQRGARFRGAAPCFAPRE